jgi:hypothetical protein
MLQYYKPTELKKLTNEEIERLEMSLDLLVVYCLAWTVLPILSDPEQIISLNT